MSGIYYHIPFCKQACHYCNFHFSTSLHFKNDLVAAMIKELEGRKDYLGNKTIQTIYFGGGTPSLLEIGEIRSILDKTRELFIVEPGAEITLEVNPDDITEQFLLEWKGSGINRLSLGIQSFFEEDLQWMNRAHTAVQALENLTLAKKYFENITIDLIYGTPGLTNEKWKQNVDLAIALDIPHISCYALTVEPKTPLHKMIRLKEKMDINPDRQSEQFLLLMQWLGDAGYEHYEISNFAKPGWRSRHNSSYWGGATYLGIGPSAHSFEGKSRQWNIANNTAYTRAIGKGQLPFEKEELTGTQQLNEYIMTSLRTSEGLHLDKASLFTISGDLSIEGQLLEASRKFIAGGLMSLQDRSLVLTNEGKLLADGIAASLFF